MWSIAAVSLYTGVTGNDNARRAQAQAKVNALETARQADEATNKANAKAPDSAAALAAAILAGKQGNASTMLTGPKGVAQSDMTLGRISMLGG
jgi:hypothetical protein